MSEHKSTDERLSDEEYMRRLRARFLDRAGEGSDAVADTVDIEDWRSGGFENDPEGAADEEMSYWEAP